MIQSPPKLIIFAGANGSGKTTVAKSFLPEIGVKEFVNADEIARGISPLNAAAQPITAGKLFLKRIDDLIAKGDDFAFETTLSGRSHIKLINRAKAAGYMVHMYYIYTPSPDLNIDRVAMRVQQGGHDVPVRDIKRRYFRSLYNLFAFYWEICDIIDIYASLPPKPVHIAKKLPSNAFEVYSDAIWLEIEKKVKDYDENA